MGNRFKTLIIFSAFYFWILPGFSQAEQEIQKVLEKYLETAETNADYTQIYEDLAAFLEKPLNLNTAVPEEILRFPLFTKNQALALIEQRNSTGMILQLAELQVIGCSPDQIRAIAPFVTLAPDAGLIWSNWKTGLHQGSKELVSNTRRKFPNVSEPYLGDAFSQSLRLRYYMPGAFSFGISAEKDAGEKWWQKGPDFYSLHASVSGLGHIKTAVIGDYLISLGQGLVLGSGIGMGKSSMVLNITRNAAVLKPYRGLNEALFQRGIAINFGIKKWQILTAVSSHQTDARTTDSSAGSTIFYTSPDADGYHRTASEIAAKHNLRTRMAGLWLLHQSRSGNWGFGGVFSDYSLPIAVSPEWYKYFDPSGKQQTFFHIFQSHTVKGMYVFSEWAFLSQNRSGSAVAGLIANTGKHLEYTLLYRNYAPGFLSQFSTAFGNSDRNEKGLYTGLIIHLSKKLYASFYQDIWQNPWFSYQLYGTGRGQDQLFQLDAVPLKNAKIYARIRVLNKPQNVIENNVHTVGSVKTQSMRLHAEFPLDKMTTLQLRHEQNLSQNNGTAFRGAVSFIQIGTFLRKFKLGFTGRWCMFQVPFYDARIYAFENQLQYDFGTMAFYGKGQSGYLLLNYKWNKFFKIGLRYQYQQSVLPGNSVNQVKQGIFVQVIYTR